MAKSDPNKDSVSNSIITRSLLWVDDPAKVLKFFWGLVAVGAVLTLLDLTYHKHSYFDAEHVFGFYSFYGFFMCAALVIAAKVMRWFLMRDEAYYGDASVEPEEHPEFDLDRKEADV